MRIQLHFVDSGLAAWLLGIRTVDQLRVHPLRGALFETWVVSEVWKAFLHDGEISPPLSYYRDRSGLEVDLLAGERFDARLVYGGDREQRRSVGVAVPWSGVPDIVRGSPSGGERGQRIP